MCYYWDVIVITTVLVTGAEGQLGSDLVLLLVLSGYKVFGMGKSELDITNEEEVNKVVSFIKTRNYHSLCCLYPSRQSRIRSRYCFSDQRNWNTQYCYSS